MKVTFLGTNGWYDTSTGNTICTLVETSKCYIIFDAGDGIYKADRYIKNNKPVYLMLSHFHLDHVTGLHILDKFNWKSLTIMGQPGTKKIIKTLLNKVFSVPTNKLPFPCNVVDINSGWHNKPFKFQCLPLVHASKSFGYRLEIDGKTLSYCADTGYCRSAEILSKDVDLLISECAFKLGFDNPNWPHMNPILAAKLALNSKAKKLALTHFDANNYRTMPERKAAEVSAKKIFKNSFAAKDKMRISI